jgi:hypothetical protein
MLCLDVDQSRPDEKSIITYVASYYHTFARMKNEMKSGRRIANVSIVAPSVCIFSVCEFDFLKFL